LAPPNRISPGFFFFSSAASFSTIRAKFWGSAGTFRKTERGQNQIGAFAKFEFLPDNGIERDIGSNAEDHHVFHKTSIRNFDRFRAFLRPEKVRANSIPVSFFAWSGEQAEVLELHKSDNRIRMPRCIEGKHRGVGFCAKTKEATE